MHFELWTIESEIQQTTVGPALLLFHIKKTFQNSKIKFAVKNFCEIIKFLIYLKCFAQNTNSFGVHLGTFCLNVIKWVKLDHKRW